MLPHLLRMQVLALLYQCRYVIVGCGCFGRDAMMQWRDGGGKASVFFPLLEKGLSKLHGVAAGLYSTSCVYI